MAEHADWSDGEVLAAFPRALVDHDNVDHFRGRLQRKLLVNRCADCGWWHEPPRPVCAKCWSDRMQAEEVSGQGVVALATILHVGPQVPGVDYSEGYPLAAVELIEQTGLRFTAGIVDCPVDEVRIGMPVEVVWTERDGEPTPAFRRTGSGR